MPLEEAAAAPRAGSFGSSDRALAAPLLALAALALGHAIEIANAHLHPWAIAWLAVALLLAAVAVAAPDVRALLRLGDEPAATLLAAAFVFEISEQLVYPPGHNLGGFDGRYLLPFRAGAAFALLVTVGPLARRLGRLRLPALLAIHLLLGVWLIRAAPDPHIDVAMIHQRSLDALLHGRNPYSLGDLPNIYRSTTMYGAGQLTAAGRLAFGYCYPPLSLLLAIPGHLVGDYRYSQLLAMSASAALMAAARPGRVASLAAALFLFTPRAFYVLEHGWTDPFVVLLLCATVYCACRRPRLLPWAVGLFLVVKQYVFLVAPALLCLRAAFVPGERLRFWGRAALAGAVVTLPLALPDVRAFVWSVLVLQFRSPFRPEALSFLAWYAQGSGRQLSAAVGFATLVPAAVLVTWRAARTPSGFAASVALLLGLFVAFNKQAFSNYYFVVIGSLCCAVAATRTSASPPDLSST